VRDCLAEHPHEGLAFFESVLAEREGEVAGETAGRAWYAGGSARWYSSGCIRARSVAEELMEGDLDTRQHRGIIIVE
jgi:hypothetical protein